MSTRAQIAIQIGPEKWAHIYCHFDGYPSHMLPALAPWTPDDILAAGDVIALFGHTASVVEFGEHHGAEVEAITGSERYQHALGRRQRAGRVVAELRVDSSQ